MEDSAREDRLLMLAVAGEPLPADDPDAELVAADVALLREQVRGLGDALAARPAPKPEPKPGPKPSPVPGRRRRPLRLALGGLVAACATALLGGMVWLAVIAPAGSDDTSSGKAAADAGAKSVPSPAMRLACSRVLVEGTVASITPRADGDVRVVLDVKRYYRPERAARDHPRFAVTLDGSARQDLRPGTSTLIRIPVYAQDRQDWETGRGVADARKEILKALPGAEGLTCAGPDA